MNAIRHPVRFTEFFCGLGGLAACLPRTASALAVDINQNALAVHALNFPHPTACKAIESLDAGFLRDAPGDLWWMSPPCQPYTRRGLGLDLQDRRAGAFKNMLKLIPELRPRNIGMENVPEFRNSAGHEALVRRLEDCGYRYRQTTRCLTEFGFFNRRKRFYLIASRDAVAAWRPVPVGRPRWQLEDGIDFARYAIPDDWLGRYSKAVPIVQADFPETGQTTACFTSAYGRSPVRSGSWLRTGAGVRFFTPREILWQLGFPALFRLPPWPPEKLWPLTGNTLALPAVRYVLSHLSWPTTRR